MKKINIFLTGLTLLLSACSVNDFDGNIPEDNNEDMVDVTLSISLEDFVNGSTRAGEEGSTLEDLSNIDMLVYAVRDKDGNVLTQYGKGVVDPTHMLTDDEGNSKVPALTNDYINQDDHRQTIMPADFRKGNTVELTLRVMRGTVFNLSLWAQSSKCNAYDFSDLTNVKIDYGKMIYSTLNENKDIYDAFCASSKFSIGQVETTLNVTMTRPFSQINAGVLTLDKDKEDYIYVNMEFKGLATGFNVVDNKAVASTTSHAFGWQSRENLPELSVDEWETSSTGGMTQTTKHYTNFGMCYVLASESSPVGIKVSIAKNAEGSDAKSIYEDEDLPVTRNWRTNLLFKNLNKAFGIIPKLSLQDINELTITDGTWHPINMPEKVIISIPPQSNEEILPNEYTYTAKLINSNGDEKDLDVTYNSVRGKFEFGINPLWLEEIRIGATIKITADYTQEFKDRYEIITQAPDAKEITSVKWAKKPTYTWNFTGGAEDNLNGYKLAQAIDGKLKDGSVGNITLEDSHGLYVQVMQPRKDTNNGRGIEYNSGIKYNSGGIERNMHFKLSSSCNINFTLSAGTSTSKYIIVDYGVTKYEPITHNFQGTLPTGLFNDADKTQGGNVTNPDGGDFGDGKGLGNIMTQSTRLETFIDYNKLLKEETKIYEDEFITDTDYNKKPYSVYIYNSGGGFTYSSISLSCVDYEPNP